MSDEKTYNRDIINALIPLEPLDIETAYLVVQSMVRNTNRSCQGASRELKNRKPFLFRQAQETTNE